MHNSDKNQIHDLVLHNVRLYPMSDNSKCSKHDQIAVTNGKITAICTQKQSGLLAAKHSVDAKGQCLLPGLIDCHTHIVHAGERSDEHEMRLNGSSYADIQSQGGGIYSSVNAVRESTIESLLAQSMKRIQHLQREGVTTLEIKSGYGLDAENEIKMLTAIQQLKKVLPMNIVSSFLGAHIVPKNMNQQEYVEDIIKNMLPEISKQKLADALDIYVENLAFNLNSMEKLFSHAKKLGLKTRVHAEQLSNQHAAESAAQLGALSADHLEYLDEQGAKSMGENSCVAVLLPSAFYFLQETKKPPVDLLRKYKVPMAIATDTNPGTSPLPSILTALHFGVHLFGLSCEEALLGVTRNAAKALGLDKKVGTLEIGKQADFGLWDISSPNFLAYQLGGVYPEKVWHSGREITK